MRRLKSGYYEIKPEQRTKILYRQSNNAFIRKMQNIGWKIKDILINIGKIILILILAKLFSYIGM